MFNGHEVDWSNCQDCGGANNIIDVILGCKDRAHINGWHLWKENGNSRYIISKYGKGETYLVSAIPNAVTYLSLFLRDFTLLRETALWEFVRTRGTKRCLKAQQQIGRFFNENNLFSNQFLKELFRHKCTYCGGDIEDVFSTVKGIFWYSVDFQHRECGVWLLPIPKLFFDKMQGLLVKLHQFF